MSAGSLPQTQGGWFLTDGGIETTLIFQEGIELPEFAAFVLLENAEGREVLKRYFRRYLEIAAAARGAGFVLESPTWRAGFDWGRKLGYDERAMQRFNHDGIELMFDLRREYAERLGGPLVVSGCIGPRGDGYQPGAPMSGEDAMRAHLPQARALAAAGRRPAHGDHDDDQRRGDRRRARRRAGGPAVRDLVHRRDRRPPAERRNAARRDRSDRSRDRALRRPTT